MQFNKLAYRLVFMLLAMVAAQAGFSAEDEKEGVWIDVRTVEEFNSGYLEGAVNIPHTEIADRIAALVPDTNTPIHLYCRSGTRAGMALEILMEMGYQDVVNEGGYEAIVAKQKQ
ncbi:MAG: hypothetical protein RLZZ385_187 [Pseudomonadota bacterium]|jgi:phage shock protein E